ncbi:MAE_28990/MAE_18760 family HEPN-like nuclease [Microbacterium sp. LWS13-1.2]|uniref:HEPN domain-containing protein n=1 Tax=Microbacterium sp. LWS13-1.2 TaxID=3135264 RepID=A0AAU6SG15_9MICO
MALESFEDGTTEVKLLQRLATEAEGGEIDETNALCRAAVVLLVSHFEAFLKTIAEEFVDTVGVGQATSGQLPVGLRMAHTLPQLESIVTSRDETQRASLLKKLGTISQLWNDDAKPPKGTLQATTLARVVTSAKTEIINDLFLRMGNRGLVCDGDLDVPADNGEVRIVSIDFGLRDVVLCRNDIAHGKSERKPTPADVTRYMQFLLALATRLQRKATNLGAQVSAGTGP